MNRSRAASAAFAVLALAWAQHARAQQWDAGLGLTLRTGVFAPDDNAATEDDQLAFDTRVDVKYRGPKLNAVARVLARFDTVRDEIPLVIPEEAYVGYNAAIRVRAGYQLLDWTATEIFHPADVVNSRNLDNSLDVQEKLGEPMVSIGVPLGNGRLTAHYMPFRIAPVAPSAASRYSPAPGVEVGDPLWVGYDGAITESTTAPQWAARVTQAFRGTDVAVHVVQHSDRHQPVFVVDPETNVLRPLLYPVIQVGGSLVRVGDSWAFKVEVAHRMFTEPRPDLAMMVPAIPNHTQTAVGIEYGWGGVGHESSIALEAQVLFGLTAEQRAQAHIFQRDALIAYRRAWNDGRGRELSLAFIIDLERAQEYFGAFRYKQRIGESWSGAVAARFVHAPVKLEQPVGLEAFDKTNQLQLQLTKHF